VDGHEKPETVNYRNKYMQHYLMCERYMYRWIQIPEEESNALEPVLFSKERLTKRQGSLGFSVFGSKMISLLLFLAMTNASLSNIT